MEAGGACWNAASVCLTFVASVAEKLMAFVGAKVRVLTASVCLLPHSSDGKYNLEAHYLTFPFQLTWTHVCHMICKKKKKSTVLLSSSMLQGGCESWIIVSSWNRKCPSPQFMLYSFLKIFACQTSGYDWELNRNLDVQLAFRYFFLCCIWLSHTLQQLFRVPRLQNVKLTLKMRYIIDGDVNRCIRIVTAV